MTRARFLWYGGQLSLFAAIALAESFEAPRYIIWGLVSVVAVWTVVVALAEWGRGPLRR
jgi:hypothetical protein